MGIVYWFDSVGGYRAGCLFRLCSRYGLLAWYAPRDLVSFSDYFHLYTLSVYLSVIYKYSQKKVLEYSRSKVVIIFSMTKHRSK